MVTLLHTLAVVSINISHIVKTTDGNSKVQIFSAYNEFNPNHILWKSRKQNAMGCVQTLGYVCVELVYYVYLVDKPMIHVKEGGWKNKV